MLDRWKISSEYLKFWFWVDLLSTIPFDTVVRTAATVNTNNLTSVRLIRIARLSRLFRLLKLARVLKMSKLLKHVEDLNINPALVNVFTLVGQIFFIAHLIACFWYFLTTEQVIGVATPPNDVDLTEATLTWATSSGIEWQTLGSKYVASLYWTITTMVAVGYGDFHAVNNRERLYSIFSMLCGGVMFGAVIAQVTRVIESRNPQARAFKLKMNEFKAYLSEKQLPQTLKLRAKNAYSYYLQKKTSFGENGILEGLPKSLLTKLVYNIYESEIAKIRLFATADVSFVTALIIHFKPFQVSHGEDICKFGDISEDIIFVMRGLVKLTTLDGVRQIITGYCTEGGYFGDFEYYRKSTRIATYSAATMCNLISIPFFFFDKAIHENIEYGSVFMDEIKRRFGHFMHVAKIPLNSTNVSRHGNDTVKLRRVAAELQATSLANQSKRASLKNLGQSFRLRFRRTGTIIREASRESLWIDGQLRGRSVMKGYVNSVVSVASSGLFRVEKYDPETKRNVITEETVESILKRYVLHPKYRGKIHWDSFVGCLILYSIIVVPVQIAFSTPSEGALRWWDLAVDFVFFFDILICFRTGYFSDEDDAVITVPDKIYNNYLKTWFWIDLLSSVPFEFIIDEAISQTHVGVSSIRLLKSIRLVRLLKLARLIKLSRYVSLVEDYVGISPATFDLALLFVQIIFIAHLLGCVWWGLGIVMSEPGHGWMDDPYGYMYGSIRESNLFTKYVCSVYYIFTTLATVGYGDILASNTLERILAIFIMLTGTVTFGYIVANVSTLMGSLDHTKHVITERVSEVTEYLAEKNVSSVLAATIIRHFRHKFNQESAYDEVSILGRLPRELTMEISLLQNNDSIKKVCIFRHITNKSIVLYLFKLLIPAYFDADQYLIKEGDPPSMISFIISGRARIYRQHRKKNVSKKEKSAKTEAPINSALLGIGSLTDANNISLGGDEGFTPIRDHVRVNTRQRHDRDILNREKFKIESEIASDIQNDADDMSKLKQKNAANKGRAYDDISDISESVNAKVVQKPTAKEGNGVRRSVVSLIDDDSDEEKDDEVNQHVSSKYSSVKMGHSNVRFSKETYEDLQKKGRIFVGEVTDGDFVGYYALMKNKPHTNSVRATIPCSVYSLRKQDIAVLTVEHPSVALLLQRALALSITLEADRIASAHHRVQRGQFINECKRQFNNLKAARQALKGKGRDVKKQVLVPLTEWSEKSFLQKLSGTGAAIPFIGKALFGSSKKKTKPIIIDGVLHLPPHSKWHKVKKMIRDAKVTATVASMSANLNHMKSDNNNDALTDNSPHRKSPASKSAHILALAMEAKLKSIDAVINENTMTYNSDDEYDDDNINKRHITSNYLNAHNFHEVVTEKSIKGNFYIQSDELKEKTKYMVTALPTYLLIDILTCSFLGIQIFFSQDRAIDTDKAHASKYSTSSFF